MEFNPSMQAEVILRKCLMVEQPAQVDQHYRPYETSFNLEIARHLGETTRVGAGTYSSGALRNSAVGLIQPASVAQGVLPIVNGWREKRVAVFIEAEIRTRSGSYKEVITGFSDHVGVTPTGAIDHRMLVYPNNYLKYRTTQIRNVTGVHHHAAVDANDQILRPINAGENAYGLRPKDSLAYLSYGDWGAGNDLYDSRVMVKEQGILSDRKNQLPSEYLSKTLTGFNTAMNMLEGFGGEESRYATAAEEVQEHSYALTNLFTLLDNECGYLRTGCFDMGSLLRLFPDRNDGTYHYMAMGPASITDYAQCTESWGKTSREAKIAFSLSNIVPSIISSFLTVSYSFQITNMTPDSQLYLGPLGPPSPMFEGIDDQNRMAAMDARLAAEIAAVLRVNDVGAFDIKCTCNLFGNSLVEIAIDGNNMIPFSTPNYCDSITSPLQSLSMGQGKQFAGDIRSAIDTVFQETRQSDMHHY